MIRSAVVSAVAVIVDVGGGVVYVVVVAAAAVAVAVAAIAVHRFICLSTYDCQYCLLCSCFG